MSLISHQSASTSIFYSTYKFRLQRLLISCLYLYSTYKIYGTCNITVYLSEHCLWINLVHSMNITDFTTNATTTDSTRVFPKVTTESHSLRRGFSYFHCLPSGLFSPLIAALHMLKRSTTSFTDTGGFVNICPTPAVANLQLIHEWKVLHEYDSMKTEN